MGSGICRFPGFGVILLLAAAAALTAASCSDSSLSTDLRNRLEQAVDKAMSNYGIPGAIVGVWSPGNGEMVMVKGKADIGTGKEPESGDRVRVTLHINLPSKCYIGLMFCRKG